jgi:Holliday junction resolvase-like predicted endonuclease
MAENRYQAKLIKKLKDLFPGCVILKNDSGYRQGMLDLIILWGKYWASLEVKDSASSSMRPNQEYYIEQLDKMSFAAKIYPENEKEVLSALQQAFKPPRRTRIS